VRKIIDLFFSLRKCNRVAPLVAVITRRCAAAAGPQVRESSDVAAQTGNVAHIAKFNKLLMRIAARGFVVDIQYLQITKTDIIDFQSNKEITKHSPRDK
jgi:hypothetical protein